MRNDYYDRGNNQERVGVYQQNQPQPQYQPLQTTPGSQPPMPSRPMTPPTVPPQTVNPQRGPKPQPPRRPMKAPGVKSPIKLRNASMAALRQFGQNQLAKEPQTDIHMLSIIGQIEGHMVLPPKNKTTKYEHIMPQLLAIEENPKIKGLLVVLNTVGGDIEAGLAISEMLASMTKPVVSLVLGGGHSIGVPIAVAADHSIIAETASMTIHPVRLTGLVISVPQTYEYLEKMQDRVVRFVTGHSNISEERFRELMFHTGELVRDVGSVLVGDSAVSEGLINQVGGLSHAMQALRRMINENEQQVH